MSVDWDALVVGPTVSIFGQIVTVYQSGLAEYHITGVFDEYSQILDAQDSGVVGANVTVPVVGCRVSDFKRTPAKGDKLKMSGNGKSYTIKNPVFDGKGGVKLELSLTRG